MLPTQSQLELPLLEILVKAGGQAKPKDVYQQMTADFPDLTDEDLARQYKGGEIVWTNSIQCKRWEGNVGRQEVDKFRGAIQEEYEQGIFFATSDFTKEAKGASLRKGAVPIVLLNGESIVELMIEKEFGIQKRPLVVYEDELDSMFGDHGGGT